MEHEPTSQNEEEKEREKATDREFTDFLIKHIENPCEVTLESGVVKNIRDFYVRLAKDEIPKMTDQEAIKDLEIKIEEYE